jgi:hypothetical protein
VADQRLFFYAATRLVIRILRAQTHLNP